DDRAVMFTQRKRIVVTAGGRESLLQIIGGVIAFIAVAGGLVLGGAGAMAEVFNVAEFVSGGALVLSGLLTYAICAGLAEIIRLLKKQNGLDYGGVIADARILRTYYQCGRCGTTVDMVVEKCPRCDCVFENEGPEK
ncbi:MAG TPA: hypothetical protein VFB72_11455, partial [Verrucomicrobiae bacterium]|nr:hypothetical protein [Verrucomicrobiae bacterium]